MHKKMLGDTIYRLRNEKGLSQSEFSRLAGISNRTVRKWETYKECPNITMLPLLNRILETTTDEVDGDLFLYYSQSS
jgi:DNA-binding transcriptional regulator YiaG